MNRRVLSLFVRYCLPTLLSILILGGGAVLLSNRFLSLDQEKRARLELEQVNAYYEVVLEEVDSLNLMFSTNIKIILQLQDLMEVDEVSWLEWRDVKILGSYIASPANARPYVESIYVYLENDRRRLLSSRDSLTTADAMGDTSWLASYEARDPAVGIWAERRTLPADRYDEGSRELLSVYRAIYNGAGRRIGVIVLNLKARALEKSYPRGSMIEGQSISVSDAEGRPLLFLSDGSEPAPAPACARFSLASDRLGWVYEMSVPKRELYRLSRTLVALTAALSIAACLIGIALTYRAHRKEESFIKKTLDLLSSARGDRIEPEGPGRDADVFDYLLTSIIRQFLERDYMKARKEAMEYRALQMQINPHFLYNTLETVNWRAVKLLGSPNDVSSMIFLISKILKYAMDIGDSPGVSLSEEVEHARYYIDLQAIRFPRRFSVEWDVEDGLGSFPVPRLMLQPLLENSFSHGLPDGGGRLMIRVRARRDGDRVLIEVEDDGRGISPEAMSRINDDDSESESPGAAGPGERRPVGLLNTKKRLFLLYKSAASMSVSPGEGRGTHVAVSIEAAAALSP